MILEKLFDPIVPTTIQKVLKWRAKKVSTDENVIVMLLDHDPFQNVEEHWFKKFGEIFFLQNDELESFFSNTF